MNIMKATHEQYMEWDKKDRTRARRMCILHCVIAVLLGLATVGVASAQNFAPDDYVYNAAKVRYERPGQPERGPEAE